MVKQRHERTRKWPIEPNRTQQKYWTIELNRIFDFWTLDFCKTFVEINNMYFETRNYFSITSVFLVFKTIKQSLLNRSPCHPFDWIAFDWVRLPNPVEPNVMDWVRFGSIDFDCFGNQTHTKFGVRFDCIVALNRTQFMEFDWVQLNSISKRSIYYACWL